MGVKLQNPRVLKKIAGLNKAFKSQIRKGLYDFGKALVKTASEEILKKPKGGRTYTIYRNGRKTTHKSSAPGEAWANLTGLRRRNLMFKVVSEKRLEFGTRLKGKDLISVNSLEFGSRFMSPRPAYSISLKKNDGKFDKIMRKRIGSIR